MIFLMKRSVSGRKTSRIKRIEKKGGKVRAEVMNYEDLIRLRPVAAVKEKGLLRIEGKDYGVQDGDVVYFRFNL